MTPLRRLLAAALVAVLLIPFAACQSGPTETQNTTSQTNVSAQKLDSLAVLTSEERAKLFEGYFSKGLDDIRAMRLDSSLKNFLEAYKIYPEDPVTPYNIACTYALLKNKAEALKWLEFSITKGYNVDKDSILSDPDLDFLKGTKEFVNIVNNIVGMSEYYPESLTVRELDPETSAKIGKVYATLSAMLSTPQTEQLFLDVNKLRIITFDEMLKDLATVSVVHVGETHDDMAHHMLQLRVFKGLHQLDPNVAVAMEQFETNDQPVLDGYTVAQGMSEADFLEKSNYPNDWSMDWNFYKGIVDYCRDNKLFAIGMNAPKSLVDKVKKEGYQSLSAEDKAQLPQIYTGDARHKAFNTGLISRMHGKIDDSSYEVMCLWEDTMADSVVKFLQKNPRHKVVVVVGGGHVQYRFGIPERVKRRLPLPYRTILSAQVPLTKDVLPAAQVFHVWSTNQADYIALTPLEHSMPKPVRTAMPRPNGPSEPPAGDAMSISDIEKKVELAKVDLEKVRGLKFSSNVNVKVISRAQASTMGVEPKIQGFYRYEDKALYIIEGSNPKMLEGVWYHELVHALQDQNFSLDKVHANNGDSEDANFAVRSLIEGEALFTMAEAMVANGDEKMKAFLDMPVNMAESQAFMYFGGAKFIKALKNAGGWDMVNKAFTTTPPTATAQILHPELYLSGVKFAGTTKLPNISKLLGVGWTDSPPSSEGEYKLYQIFASNPETKDNALEITGGWRGDAFATFTNLSSLKTVELWKIEFSTLADAKEFLEGYSKVARKSFEGWTEADKSPTVRTWTKGDVVSFLLISGSNIIEVSGVSAATVDTLIESLK